MPEIPPSHIVAILGYPVLAYLLGAVPWGIVVTRVFTSVDIRKQGSGNIGATNVSRVAGSTPGLLTFTGDVLKGAVPVYLASITAGQNHVAVYLVPAVVALAAFFGHLFPVYTKFRSGGKGVATCAGCFLVLSPPACLSALLTFLIFLFLSKRVSVGSMAAAAVLPCMVWFTTQSLPITISAIFMAVFIFLRHAANIRRLISGTEPIFREKP